MLRERAAECNGQAVSDAVDRVSARRIASGKEAETTATCNMWYTPHLYPEANLNRFSRALAKRYSKIILGASKIPSWWLLSSSRAL